MREAASWAIPPAVLLPLQEASPDYPVDEPGLDGAENRNPGERRKFFRTLLNAEGETFPVR
jgi:hypothetical protein